MDSGKTQIPLLKGLFEMKKIRLICLLLALVLCLCVVFASCGPDETPDDGGVTPPPVTPPEENPPAQQQPDIPDGEWTDNY